MSFSIFNGNKIPLKIKVKKKSLKVIYKVCTERKGYDDIKCGTNQQRQTLNTADRQIDSQKAKNQLSRAINEME